MANQSVIATVTTFVGRNRGSWDGKDNGVPLFPNRLTLETSPRARHYPKQTKSQSLQYRAACFTTLEDPTDSRTTNFDASTMFTASAVPQLAAAAVEVPGTPSGSDKVLPSKSFGPSLAFFSFFAALLSFLFFFSSCFRFFWAFAFAVRLAISVDQLWSIVYPPQRQSHLAIPVGFLQHQVDPHRHMVAAFHRRPNEGIVHFARQIFRDKHVIHTPAFV
jgi:hypothetical protein